MRQNGGFQPFGEPGGPQLLVPPNFGSLVRWAAALAVVAVLFLGIVAARNVYTDWLWYSSLGLLSVFKTILWAKIVLFVAGALVSGAVLGINLWLVRRSSRGESALPLPEETVRWLDRVLWGAVVLGAVVIAVFFGASASAHWELVLRILNGASFGVADPVFNEDVAFYVFTLPLLRSVQGWFLSLFMVLLASVAAVYLARAAVRGLPVGLYPAMRAHLAVVGALVFVALAAGHYLDRYDLLFSRNGAVVGATYADVHARLQAYVFMAAIAVAAGVMLLATVVRNLQGQRGARLIIGAVGLWVAAVLAGGQLYPVFVQRFNVTPNELEKEKPYIERNIQFTRAAFNLDTIAERPYNYRELTLDDINNNASTINNVRLWDPRPLLDLYNQIQHLRLYYQFGDVDVDRYVVNGQYRQVLVGPRELSPDNLPTEAQNWVNQKLQYTHGYGVAASPVTEFTREGRPEFFVMDIPPTGPIALTRPEIYFGEHTENYVIANSLQAEFDRPTTEDKGVYVKYQGVGGVSLSSFVRRAAYAWQFGDVNILISSLITPDSKLMYRRDIKARITTIAPFLTLDRDPYIVVTTDGRLVWIQDAYTTSERYPYSTPVASSFSSSNFNYIRNSVKVVTDAYNGTVEFYIADPTDPIIQTYNGIFPTLFRSLDQMPADLRAHLRYPEDLFSLQAQSYLQYHMTDPTVFFNKEDQWSIPQEVFGDRQQPVVPYYVIMRLPGETNPEFVLILPFTPAEKPNMVAWLAARMDGPEYGKLLSFQFPRGFQLDGPIQIESRINNDTVISQQFTLWNQQGSQVIRGNLLVIPMGDSVLYVEPVYLQATQGARLPELKRVILGTTKRVVMEPTLQEAITSLFGAPSGGTTPGDGTGTTPGGNDAAQQLEKIKQALKALQGNLGSLQEQIDQLGQLLAPTPTPTPKGTAG